MPRSMTSRRDSTGSRLTAPSASVTIRDPGSSLGVSSTTGSEPHLPFGGMRASSTPDPKEQGLTAREFFTETKAVYATVIR
jgi:alpha-ketoglutaric semialdehyde dehydrogenase